jgi:NRAMP (natural resistance-associated macrophage protein)-like metal ion transporter
MVILKNARLSAKKIRKSERRAANIAKSILNYKRFNRFLRMLGPGIVTGAADDDPSGIVTYSQAGAIYGTSLLWLFPIMYPMLLAVQESCARIGAITGKGLASVIKENYNKKLLYIAVVLVVSANIINIGADLGAIITTTQLLLDLPYIIIAVAFTAVILFLEIFVSYKNYSKILKWLTLSLLAYPIAAIIVGQNWGELLYATFHPNIVFGFGAIYIIVGLLGTTISPYLFFWDTSEIVEDEIEHHRLAENTKKEPKISKRFIRNIRIDNFVGMTLATIGAWFIVVTCASVLHAHGITNIDSAAEAAKALEPIVSSFTGAGTLAKIIFSVGILGLGLLAIPVLAGSSSYAISEAIGWKEGLHKRFSRAIGFYGIIIVATLAGLAINLLGINPIKALVFAAVFNGITAVPLLLIIRKIGNNQNIMGKYKNGRLSNLFITLAFIIMLAAAGFMLVSLATSVF